MAKKELNIKNKQEELLKLQIFENQVSQYGEQLKIIEQQINELNQLKTDLEFLEKSKEDEIFSEFGKGIYIKSVVKKQLLVDVGSKVLVPKTFNEIKEVVDNQVEKFDKIKPEILNQIESINQELDKIINENELFKNGSQDTK
jgi:prefoldin alpha subunit